MPVATGVLGELGLAIAEFILQIAQPSLALEQGVGVVPLAGGVGGEGAFDLPHAIELGLHLGGQHLEGGGNGHRGHNGGGVVVAATALARAGGQIAGRGQGIDGLESRNIGVEAHHIGGGDHVPLVGFGQAHQVGKLPRPLYLGDQHRRQWLTHQDMLALEGQERTRDRKGHHLRHVVGQHRRRLLLQGLEQSPLFLQALLELGVVGQQGFVKGGQLGLLMGDRPLEPINLLLLGHQVQGGQVLAKAALDQGLGLIEGMGLQQVEHHAIAGGKLAHQWIGPRGGQVHGFPRPLKGAFDGDHMALLIHPAPPRAPRHLQKF